MAKTNEESRLRNDDNFDRIMLLLKNAGHIYYKTYAPMFRIEQILNEKCIYLSDGFYWNDASDKAIFMSGDEKKRYGKCFATEKKESVAMWMLYGGRAQTGGMISFSRADIRDIISQNSSISIGYFAGEKFVERTRLSGVTLDMYDILYYDSRSEEKSQYGKSPDGKETQKKISVRTRNSGSAYISEDVLKRIWNRKSSAWDYEDECRLVLEIDKEMVSSNEDEMRFAKIIIPDVVIERIRSKVYCAPNCNDSLLLEKYSKSTLAGEVDWDLCKECTK